MKKIVFIFSIFLALSAYSQNSAIKANPLGLAVGVLNASYEFGISDSNTISANFSYYDVSGVSGLGIGGEYRFYFGDEILKGWHAEPSANAFFLKDTLDTKATVFSLGATGGYQWVFGSGFLVDVFGGYNYFFGGDTLAGLDTGVPVLGASIGYAW